MTCSYPPINDVAVVVFGDGTLPEMLLTCLQFRLVADLATSERAEVFHLAQLHRHIERGRCGACTRYLVGRMLEVRGRAEWVARLGG